MTAVSLRWTVTFVLLMALFTACRPLQTNRPFHELTPETEASLVVNAVERACDHECSGLTIYLKAAMIGGHPLPQSTEDAIRQMFDDVVVVSHDEADALFGADFLVDSGNGALITVGPASDLAEEVIGIQIDLQTSRDGGRGQILLFQWSGEEWRPATSEDTGVTVTSWVS